jgi:hypothetical protein
MPIVCDRVKPQDDSMEGKIAVAIEVCQCGCETFYISKARDVYCATCETRIDNITVFNYDANKRG